MILPYSKTLSALDRENPRAADEVRRLWGARYELPAEERAASIEALLEDPGYPATDPTIRALREMHAVFAADGR